MRFSPTVILSLALSSTIQALPPSAELVGRIESRDAIAHLENREPATGPFDIPEELWKRKGGGGGGGRGGGGGGSSGGSGGSSGWSHQAPSRPPFSSSPESQPPTRPPSMHSRTTSGSSGWSLHIPRRFIFFGGRKSSLGGF